MRLALDKIKACLDEYLTYDWQVFNDLEMLEQCQEWKVLENNFNDLLKKEYIEGTFDFEKVYSLIRSYDDKFKKLPIEGKLYIKVNKRLLKGQLIKIVKEIEYQEAKRIDNPQCECQILSRFGKEPKTSTLKEIGIINDSYYMPKLFKCNNCEFLWSSYISNDSTAQLIFEKHNPEDNHLIKYYP